MLGLVHAQTCRPLVAATVSSKADSRRGRVLVGSSRTRLPKSLKLGSGVGAKKIFSVGTRAVAAGPPPTPTGRDKDDKKGKGDATLEVGEGVQRRVSSSGVPPGGSAGGAPPPSKAPPSTGIASSSPPSEVTEAFQRVQREAIESQTRVRLAMMKKEKEEMAKVKEAADRETAEVTQAAENARKAEELGGRRPTQRVAGPIFVAGVQCSFMASLAYYATVVVADNLVMIPDSSRATYMAKHMGLTFTAGGGVALAAFLGMSAGLLFAFAFKEGIGVIRNTPIIYYRCDGAGPSCCKNGPHNLGYNKKFTYLNNGRGFETRQFDCMRRHLKVSKSCRPLKPLIVYPKDEGWKLW